MKNKLLCSASCLLVEFICPFCSGDLLCCDCQHMRQPSLLPSTLSSVSVGTSQTLELCSPPVWLFIRPLGYTSFFQPVIFRDRTFFITGEKRAVHINSPDTSWSLDFTKWCDDAVKTPERPNTSPESFSLWSLWQLCCTLLLCGHWHMPYDGDEKGEGWPQKLADVNQHKGRTPHV